MIFGASESFLSTTSCRFSGSPSTSIGSSCALIYTPPKHRDYFIKRTAKVVGMSFLSIFMSWRVVPASAKTSSAAYVSNKEYTTYAYVEGRTVSK